MKFFCVVVLLLISGCASIESRLAGNEPSLDPSQQSDQVELGEAQKRLEQGRLGEARALFHEFQERRANSIYVQAARLGEAQTLQQQGQFQEAADLYRDVYLKTLKHQPEIAALALYHMSFSYEALGDDLKTVAALVDAQRLKEHLPVEIALAEIPARLAAVYGRQDRAKEAILYLQEADKGIAKVSAQRADLPTQWLAKTYFQMGSVSTNQLSAENFDAFLQGQKWVQVYLIKALKQDDGIWSLRAQEKLQETYRDLHQQLKSLPRREDQLRLVGNFFELMDQAELYRPLTGQDINSYEKNFFSYLTDVRKNTERLVFSGLESTSLTEESKRLNSIKRAGRVKTDSLLPQEKKSSIPLPPKTVPSEDPNL